MGSELLACEQLPIAQGFEPIAMGFMPSSIESWAIRNDQRYLFQMVASVNSGICNDKLASEKPGLVSTARWLTTASRILRLYVSKQHPSAALRKLVAFIVKVYAPFWFLVKSQPQAILGSRHFFIYICWIRQFPMDFQILIRPTIEYNAYFCQPENILVSMITDPDQSIRSEGYQMIRTARYDPPVSVREFYVPKQGVINFDSECYSKMIDWSQFKITEPPCLQFCTDDQLASFEYSDNEIIRIPEFPCHSQSTERFVRVVSESALAVTDEKRLGYIFAKLESRERYSHLESRQN